MTKRLIRNIFIIFGIIIVMFIMVFVKVYIGSIKEFKRGEEAMEARDYNKAITHYERSIHWYTPLNSYVARSAKRLWEIGALAEENGDNDLALTAYRSLRSSFYAVRSFYIPYKEWIDKCDDKISHLVALKRPYSERDKKKSYSQRKKESLKVLKKDYASNVGWSIFLEIGFFGWVGCTIGFILRAFEGEKGFNGRKAIFWGGLVIIFYAMWIVGMMKA